jgi:hypothetical protein
VLLLTGIAVTNLVGREIVSWWEALMNRIPVVRSIYSGAKTFTETVFTDKGKSFKQVLLVEFPRKGMFSIGLQSGENLGEASARDRSRVTLRVRADHPEPHQGFIIMVPQEDVIPLEMSVDECASSSRSAWSRPTGRPPPCRRSHRCPRCLPHSRIPGPRFSRPVQHSMRTHYCGQVGEHSSARPSALPAGSTAAATTAG